MQRFCASFFTFVFVLIFAACRSEEAPYGQQTWEDIDDGSVVDPPEEPDSSTPNEPESELPVFTKWPFLEIENKNTEEEEPEYPEYTTDLYLYGDCNLFPDSIAVSRNVSAGICPFVNVIPLMDDYGDFFEVAALISWSVDDPSIVALDFPLGPNNNLALPIGMLDAIDMNGVEPWTVLHACALNNCPTPCPANCMNEVCAELDIVSVVTVSGDWLLTSFEYDGAAVSLAQAGREFEDPSHLVKRGLVNGITVTFESGDYRYDGEIASDRQSMSGTVTDLIGLGPAGSWFAVRE